MGCSPERSTRPLALSPSRPLDMHQALRGSMTTHMIRVFFHLNVYEENFHSSKFSEAPCSCRMVARRRVAIHVVLFLARSVVILWHSRSQRCPVPRIRPVLQV